jgi:hypothetical protein
VVTINPHKQQLDCTLRDIGSKLGGCTWFEQAGPASIR